MTGAALAVLRLVTSRAPRVGATRLLCVDGPAGSGKTTLAAGVMAAAGSGRAVVVHTDELLAGWDGGLPRMVEALVSDVLEPLAAGRPAAFHRWDWRESRFADRVPVPVRDLLVVEGVGAGSRAATAYASALVWLEADPDVRRDRGIARDGDDFAPHWDAWADREQRHLEREGTRDRADLVLHT